MKIGAVSIARQAAYSSSHVRAGPVPGPQRSLDKLVPELAYCTFGSPGAHPVASSSLHLSGSFHVCCSVVQKPGSCVVDQLIPRILQPFLRLCQPVLDITATELGGYDQCSAWM